MMNADQPIKLCTIILTHCLLVVFKKIFRDFTHCWTPPMTPPWTQLNVSYKRTLSYWFFRTESSNIFLCKFLNPSCGFFKISVTTVWRNENLHYMRMIAYSFRILWSCSSWKDFKNDFPILNPSRGPAETLGVMA